MLPKHHKSVLLKRCKSVQTDHQEHMKPEEEDLNIAVCVKPVPDPEKYDQIRIDPQTKRLVREDIPTVINEADKNALETAIRIRDEEGGRISVFSMTPLFSEKNIRECLAMGADEAYIVSDKAFGGADTYATSYTLMKAMEKAAAEADEPYDLILAGNESADGATSHVPSQIGEWMDLPHISNITEIEINGISAAVTKKIAGGAIDYEVELPAVFGIARGANKPRLINAMGIIKAKKKKLEILTREDLDLDETKIGLEGSPTKAGSLLTPDTSRGGQKLEGSPEEIADQILSIVRKSGIEI